MMLDNERKIFKQMFSDDFNELQRFVFEKFIYATANLAVHIAKKEYRTEEEKEFLEWIQRFSNICLQFHDKKERELEKV